MKKLLIYYCLLFFLWSCNFRNIEVKLNLSNIDTFQNVIFETERLLNKLPAAPSISRAKYYSVQNGEVEVNCVIISDFDDFQVEYFEHNLLFNNFSLEEKNKFRNNIIYLYNNHIYSAIQNDEFQSYSFLYFNNKNIVFGTPMYRVFYIHDSIDTTTKIFKFCYDIKDRQKNLILVRLSDSLIHFTNYIPDYKSYILTSDSSNYITE